jgi:hypothetical protein
MHSQKHPQKIANPVITSLDFRHKLLACFIALSLCVPFFYITRQWAETNGHNTITPFIFTGMSQGIHSDHFDQLRPVWKPRVGAMWCSAQWLAYWNPQDAEGFKDVCGSYHVIWFGMTLFLLVFALKEPIFPILAVFAGTVYAIQTNTDTVLYDDVHILPWDFPALFFWTLAFLLWRRKHFKSMVAAMIFGTVFKETVALLAILLFFSGKEYFNVRGLWEKRGSFGSVIRSLVQMQAVRLFAMAFVGCLVVKLFITQVILGQPVVFTANHRAVGALWASISRFLAWEFHPHLNTILWADGGLALAVFLLPCKSSEDKGIICILVLFYFFLAVAEIIDGGTFEVRHWTDPMAILAIYFQDKLYPTAGALSIRST